ncbi:MAG: hypothetical protein ABJB49_00805 [Nitrospirota bacterium]
MKRTVILSLGMLLSFALAGAYAGQGQTGFGGASGEASPEPDVKSPPPAKTRRASTAPKTSQSDMKAGSAAQSATAPSVKAATSGRTATIEGEVLRIRGNSYTVKDTSGKTVRLRVDKDTKLDSNISQHDMVIANASEMTIRKSSASPKTVWHADSMSKQ